MAAPRRTPRRRQASLGDLFVIFPDLPWTRASRRSVGARLQRARRAAQPPPRARERRFRSKIATRRDGRVVDGGGLENHCTRKGTGGSNPSPSAKSLGKASIQQLERRQASADVFVIVRFLSVSLLPSRFPRPFQRLNDRFFG